MRPELKRQELAKLYREFSRQKYNKYRHQFPRMRESELVSKIIKEWEAFSTKEKEDLYQTYIVEKHISEDKSESSEKRESPGSSKSKRKIHFESTEDKSRQKSSDAYKKSEVSRTPVKKAGVKVFVKSSSSKKEKEQQSESSDFARDGAKKDFEISESDSKELGKKVGGKRKRIIKVDRQPKTEYLKFFKFYYDKLSREHARWSANQISTIIKLLWKRKLVTDKVAAKSLLKAPKERRRISGRMAFRRNFNYTSIEGAERWKQLPKETKKYWKNKGEGLLSGERRVINPYVHFNRISRKSSQSSIATQTKALSFLTKSMFT